MDTATDALVAAVEEKAARVAAARRHLVDFATYVDPSWIPARHLELIAEHLERLERGEIPGNRLCICMPPRSGKSELAARKFVAWYLSRHPTHQIILASYGAELSEGHSRAVRTMLQQDDYPFKGIKLRADSSSVARWETKQGGVVIAASIESGLTGRGGDLILCDDLVKGAKEAESDATRKSTAEWFSSVLLTRAQPNAKIVLIGTRWHESDVMSTAFQGKSGDRWTKLVLPLLAEENDPLGRKPGELLWPQRFSIDDYPSVERGEISSRTFAAIYSQRPTPAVGNRFKREWFEQRYPGGFPREIITEQYGELSPGVYDTTSTYERPFWTCLAIDCASKTGAMNDWSALCVCATNGVDYFIVDVVRERLEFSDLLRRVQEVYHKWGPQRVYIEEASSGIPIVQELRRSTNLPIIGVPPIGSKEARATAVEPLFEAKKIFLPDGAHWIDMFVDEFASFPNGRHDDMVDATVLGLSKIDEIALNYFGSQETTWELAHLSIER